MHRLGSLIFLIAVASSLVCGQAQPGSISIRARSAFPDEKVNPLTRKRFYLFAGGLAENKGMTDRVHNTPAQSRDCFYASQKASACLVDWLRQLNCESVFCRTVTQEDVGRVP